MRTSRKLVLVAGGLVAACVLMAQSGGNRRVTTDLGDWLGRDCTVHLSLEADPRAGRASYSGNTSNGIQSVEEMPITVSGTLIGASGDAVVLALGTGHAWVPRPHIRLITLQPKP